jgi:hypothetical protein
LGKKLFAAAGEPKRFVALSNHDHNDRLPEEYYREVDDFLASAIGE